MDHQNQQRWRSPRGGHGSPSWQSPRFRGSPGYSPNQGRYQSPGQHFRPYNRHGSPYDNREFGGGSPRSPYRPRGGFHQRHSSPQFFNDRSFNSPNSRQGSDRDNIENWVSPEMWGDPWEHLCSQLIATTTQESSFVSEELPAVSDLQVHQDIDADNKPPDKINDSEIPIDDDE